MFKKIIHIDMDAFYASVEQRDNPNLANLPVAVGWDSSRGVIATASYEARKFGVRSAMPVSAGKKLCPELIIVEPRMDAYKNASVQIRSIFAEYTDLVEPLSLDEAYLDVTNNKLNLRSATIIAREIKRKIKNQTHLTASAGISINKFLAKIASDMNKPDGLTLIHPNKALEFLKQLKIEKFHGIGKVTARRMRNFGISKGIDIIHSGEEFMLKNFGKNGKFFFQIAQGIDNREVSPARERKSVSVENTFAEDLTITEDIHYELRKLAYVLAKRIHRNQFISKTLTLKIKFSDFKIINRSKTGDNLIADEQQIRELGESMLDHIQIEKGVRLLGLGVTKPGGNKEDSANSPSQLTLDF
jgi:DNA polymerase-4